MPTTQPTGFGDSPSAVILAFPALSPKMRAAALFRKALQAAIGVETGGAYASA